MCVNAQFSRKDCQSQAIFIDTEGSFSTKRKRSFSHLFATINFFFFKLRACVAIRKQTNFIIKNIEYKRIKKTKKIN